MGIGGGEQADEMDWNIYVIPATYEGDDNHFAYLIDGAKASGVHDCDGTNNCMEGEVTPDDGKTASGAEFYNNPWFYVEPETGEWWSFITDYFFYSQEYYSPLKGQLICMYGPWVGDGGHGGRPEIHPSEAIWWRDGENKQENVTLLGGGTVPQGDGAYHIMLLQDDSNRFYRIDCFIAPGGGKKMSEVDPEDWEDWQPWAQSPRSAVFRISFEVEKPDVGAPTPIYFGIQEVPDGNGAFWARNVITGNDKEDSPEKEELCAENPNHCLAFHDAPPDSNEPTSNNKNTAWPSTAYSTWKSRSCRTTT